MKCSVDGVAAQVQMQGCVEIEWQTVSAAGSAASESWLPE